MVSYRLVLANIRDMLNNLIFEMKLPRIRNTVNIPFAEESEVYSPVF